MDQNVLKSKSTIDSTVFDVPPQVVAEEAALNSVKIPDPVLVDSCLEFFCSTPPPDAARHLLGPPDSGQ